MDLYREIVHVQAVGSGAEVGEMVADKGYHNNETVLELKELGIRGYLSETDRGRRNWKGKNRKYQAPVYANRRRIRGRQGRRLQRRRSELVERPFAHQFVMGLTVWILRILTQAVNSRSNPGNRTDFLWMKMSLKFRTSWYPDQLGNHG